MHNFTRYAIGHMLTVRPGGAPIELSMVCRGYLFEDGNSFEGVLIKYPLCYSDV